MVIGLLTLAAIPTVTAISLGIQEKNRQVEARKDEKLMRKFTLVCWCEGKSKGKSDIHGGEIVVGEEKMWIQSPKRKPTSPLFPFQGFYISYPDDERDPAPMGLVSQVANDPPLLNWIYVHDKTNEVKHGNRTQSRPHRVGSFGYDNGGEEDEEEAGGLVFEGEERFVAVGPRRGDKEGRWEVWWDENDNRLKGVKEVEGRMVLRISLERSFIEEAKAP